MSVMVTFTFDPAEHYRATRAVMRRTWWRWLPLVVGIIILLSVAEALWFTQRSGQPLRPTLLSLAPWVTLMVLWLAAIPLSQRWSASRLAHKDASLQGLQERTVDAVGYHSRGNGVHLDVPWHVMYGVRETVEFLFFYYNKNMAYYIPKRAVRANELVQIRDIARAGVGDDRAAFVVQAG